MHRWEIMCEVTAQRVFGIVRSGTAQEAHRAGEAVLDAGLGTVEVAMTTHGALSAVTRLCETRPEALIGAGTVLDEAAAVAAVQAGARFLVSPSLQPEVIRAGHRYGVPVIPGASTPTEMLRALEEGADAVKIFPASGVGASWLRDVRAALPQLPAVPTGGVTIEAAPEWVAAGAVACGMGSALTSGGPARASERVSRLLDSLAKAR